MEDMTYAKAMAELESIVAKMQSDNCDIDSLADYTTRAMDLLKYCRGRLTETDEKVKQCLEQIK